MKRLTYLILAVFMFVVYEGIASYAAVDKEVSPDDVIDYVVQERLSARQGYDRYKLQKEARQRDLVQVKIPMVEKEVDALYTRSKNDIMVGMGLIGAAVILIIYVHQLSRREKVK